MTKIDVTIAEPRYAVVFDGHAGLPEVCSGISSLMYALATFLDSNDDLLFFRSTKMDEPGWGHIVFELEDRSPRIKGGFELFLGGILGIQNSYPDYCKVVIHDMSEKKF